jgi:hypothetical protein
MMREQFGTRVMDKPNGMLRAVHFPSLATMDHKTGDGRILESAGRGVRELPRPIFGQYTSAPGHDGAIPVGRLDTVIFHDDGNIEGWGWLSDDDNGRMAARYIDTKVVFHNSVDLAEVKVKLEIEEEDDMLSLLLRFAEWSVARTTIVGTPAFPDAYAEMDEVTASFYEDQTPLEWVTPTFEVHVPDAVAELTASATLECVAWSDFHIPEADGPQKIIVNDAGVVFGHLGLWDVPDDTNPLIKVPRPPDNYASFNQPGVLTDLGQVETGPIFLLGGHPKGKIGMGDPTEAYGGIENAWADVRVIPGRFGPWLSGRVRPGVDDEVLYAARASRISGHWVGNKLRAIVSVNVPRFNIPGSGLSADSTYEASFSDVGELLELVASFPDHLAIPVVEETEDEELSEIDEYMAESAEVVDFAVDTTPTTEMAAEAEQGLNWRREFKRGGGGVALARARDIKNRKRLSKSTLNRMQSFFQRHAGDKADPGWAQGQEGYPSAARINWALWGGDAAQGWVSGKLSAIQQDSEAAVEADVLLLELALQDD